MKLWTIEAWLLFKLVVDFGIIYIVTGFASMQNVGFIGSWLLPHTLQRKAKMTKNYNVDYSTGSCMKL